MKLVETSNSIFVVDDNALVKQTTGSYYECLPIKYQGHCRIRDILCKNTYKGQMNEIYDDSITSTTINDLLDVIPLSKLELLHVLNDLDAVEINGQWRRLDPEYIHTFLKSLFAFYQIEEMAIDSQVLFAKIKGLIDIHDESLWDDYTEEIVKHIMKIMSIDKTSECKRIEMVLPSVYFGWNQNCSFGSVTDFIRKAKEGSFTFNRSVYGQVAVFIAGRDSNPYRNAKGRNVFRD
jgi:hypothetical protein